MPRRAAAAAPASWGIVLILPCFQVPVKSRSTAPPASRGSTDLRSRAPCAPSPPASCRAAARASPARRIGGNAAPRPHTAARRIPARRGRRRRFLPELPAATKPTGPPRRGWARDSRPRGAARRAGCAVPARPCSIPAPEYCSVFSGVRPVNANFSRRLPARRGSSAPRRARRAAPHCIPACPSLMRGAESSRFRRFHCRTPEFPRPARPEFPRRSAQSPLPSAARPSPAAPARGWPHSPPPRLPAPACRTRRIRRAAQNSRSSGR